MKRMLIAGSLALASMNAMADEDKGFYLSGGFGESKYDISQDDLDDVALAAFNDNGAFVIDADSTFDDKGDALVLMAGYRFSRYISVEAGYVDLGTIEYRGTGSVLIPGLGIFDSSVGVDISAKGPMIAGTAYIPLGQKFDLHGHLGILFADTEFDISVGLDGETASEKVKASSEDAFAGIGAAFHFNKHVALSFDYTLFQDVGDEEETGEGDVDSLRLSIQYRF